MRSGKGDSCLVQGLYSIHGLKARMSNRIPGRAYPLNPNEPTLAGLPYLHSYYRLMM